MQGQTQEIVHEMLIDQGIKILGKLNAGGMGEVYLAIKYGPLGTRQPVVLKMPLVKNGAFKWQSDKWRSEFEDEARVMAYLNHPNIVRTIDWIEMNGRPCIVSEYIHGLDLRQIIRFFNVEGKPMPLYVTSQIMLQACDAFQYIHSAKTFDGKALGIVHRDIDPSNIMIADNGFVKIIDFGIAKNSAQKELTKPGVYKGKFAYLAPDVFLPEKVDLRADVFSLGLVFYELLTGKRLRQFHDTASLATVVTAIKETTVPAPSSIVPHIPPALDKIVLRATSPKKDDRYNSMYELAIDIRNVSKKLNSGSDHEYLKQWANRELSKLRALRAHHLTMIQQAREKEAGNALLFMAKPETVNEQALVVNCETIGINGTPLSINNNSVALLRERSQLGQNNHSLTNDATIKSISNPHAGKQNYLLNWNAKLLHRGYQNGKLTPALGIVLGLQVVMLVFAVNFLKQNFLQDAIPVKLQVSNPKVAVSGVDTAASPQKIILMPVVPEKKNLQTPMLGQSVPGYVPSSNRLTSQRLSALNTPKVNKKKKVQRIQRRKQIKTKFKRKRKFVSWK